MSTCPHILRGPGIEMRARAANDDVPAASVMPQSGNVVGLSADRNRARPEPQPELGRDHDDIIPFDDVLAFVRAAMAQPSP
jgi:hypothetical protein